ncbi:MAG: polysaccharide biosynthesis tyrosine autokinase [Gammaproteobacteria bacterium]
MLSITLDAPDPAAVKARLNAIANSYLRQNVQRQSEEARRTLAGVNGQLPRLRENVNITEAAMRDYQAEQGTVDLSLEAQGILNSMATVEQRISGLGLRRAALMRTFTENHPLVESLDERRARLKEDRARIEEQMKELPDIESDYLKLARNAKVANGLYLQLLNRAQELKVTEAGVTGYVRIVDYAFKPLLPAGPSRVRILLVAIALGGVCAAGIIFLKRALARTLETPDLIERKLGLPVYATIPHSKHQSAVYRSKRKKPGSGSDVLARSASTDNAIESLRSLRTSLQFALIDAKNNIITITGPTPGLGKTFVAVNLAFLLADINKRVLLIDADLRRGHTPRYLEHARTPGLSDVIAGRSKLSQSIHLIDNKGLYFMATGTIPPNPSELLVHDNFNRLIEQVSEDYDMIIFDTPPILNLTDGIITAKQSGITFLVVRGGESTIYDVEHSAKRLQQNDIKLNGVIFNDLKLSASKYGYGKYGYYNYQYKPGKPGA